MCRWCYWRVWRCHRCRRLMRIWRNVVASCGAAAAVELRLGWTMEAGGLDGGWR